LKTTTQGRSADDSAVADFGAWPTRGDYVGTTHNVRHKMDFVCGRSAVRQDAVLAEK
jgi:hypothetical protein